MKKSLTRRSFLLTSAVTAFGLSSGFPVIGQTLKNGLFQAPTTVDSDPLARLTVSDFVGHVGEVFTVYPEEGRALRLQLLTAESVCETSKWCSGYSGEAYSLLFEAPRKTVLQQDVYQFDHYRLGQFKLLLVPVGLTGRRLEAIINRLHE